jgi:SAM-dependent methyltransferase
VQRWQGGGRAAQTLRVLDLGVGTGRFLHKLHAAGLRIRPYGLDISQKMIDIARARIADLHAAVDDAANLEAHFPGVSFDLAATHFVTGFVPVAVLAPKIAARLNEGGLWSFVGGTMAGFPVLQHKANSKFIRWLFRLKTLDVGAFACNPAGQTEVVDTLVRNGFAVRECETFRPAVHFRNMNEFLDFAYYGGWLTPFIEAMGLHRARPALRALITRVLFPIHDHHEIVIALAQKKRQS